MSYFFVLVVSRCNLKGLLAGPGRLVDNGNRCTVGAPVAVAPRTGRRWADVVAREGQHVPGHEQPLSRPFLGVTWSPGDPPFSSSASRTRSRQEAKKGRKVGLRRRPPALSCQKPAEVTPVCIARSPLAASDCRAAPAVSCYVRAPANTGETSRFGRRRLGRGAYAAGWNLTGNETTSLGTSRKVIRKLNYRRPAFQNRVRSIDLLALFARRKCSPEPPVAASTRCFVVPGRSWDYIGRREIRPRSGSLRLSPPSTLVDSVRSRFGHCRLHEEGHQSENPDLRLQSLRSSPYSECTQQRLRYASLACVRPAALDKGGVDRKRMPGAGTGNVFGKEETEHANLHSTPKSFSSRIIWVVPTGVGPVTHMYTCNLSQQAGTALDLNEIKEEGWRPSPVSKVAKKHVQQRPHT
ncbi:hypothetical protein MTO96_002688 [Rhipicephalus appendiculatus]